MKEKMRLAIIRAIWTGCQTILGFYTVGMAITDIDWQLALSVTAAAVIFSIVKSIALGMPEDIVATVMTEEEVDELEGEEYELE